MTAPPIDIQEMNIDSQIQQINTNKIKKISEKLLTVAMKENAEERMEIYKTEAKQVHRLRQISRVHSGSHANHGKWINTTN